MRTRAALLIALCAPLAIARAVSGCGGSDSSTGGGGDDGGGSDGTVSGDGGGSGDGSAMGDGTSGGDGGTTGDSGGGTDSGGNGDGGSASNPGLVSCGQTPCVIDAGESCCTRADAGSTCVTGNGGNVCPAPSIHKRCDEAADCPNGQVCCYELGGGSVNTACAVTCNVRPQACKTTAECKNDGGSCAVHSCTGALSGQSIESCSGVPTVCP